MQCLVASVLALSSFALVLGDAIDPTGELGALIESVQVASNAYAHLLRDIFCSVVVAHARTGMLSDTCPVAVYQYGNYRVATMLL